MIIVSSAYLLDIVLKLNAISFMILLLKNLLLVMMLYLMKLVHGVGIMKQVVQLCSKKVLNYFQLMKLIVMPLILSHHDINSTKFFISSNYSVLYPFMCNLLYYLFINSSNKWCSLKEINEKNERCQFSTIREPTCFEDTVQMKEWCAGMDDEIEALKQHNTC